MKKRQFIIDFDDSMSNLPFEDADLKTIKSLIEDVLEDAYTVTVTNIEVVDVDPMKKSISVEDVIDKDK